MLALTDSPLNALIFLDVLEDFALVIVQSVPSQLPCSLSRRSAAARLLRLRTQIPIGSWMFVCCECWVLFGRGLCDELITHLEESYHLWYIIVCDLETSRMRKQWPALGYSITGGDWMLWWWWWWQKYNVMHNFCCCRFNEVVILYP